MKNQEPRWWEVGLEEFISSGAIGRPIHIHKLKAFIREVEDSKKDTLEELIERCGDDFYSLSKDQNPIERFGLKWTACTLAGKIGVGATPKEAVQNLLAKLEEK